MVAAISDCNIGRREEYNKYYSSYIEWKRQNENDRCTFFIFKLKNKDNIIEIRNKLSFKEFSDHVTQCYGELQSDLEYSKLGHTILSFINLHSDLFSISEETTEKGNSFTVIYPGKYIEELLNTFSLSDISKLPMICKPINWELDPNSNEIINYGGYINNKDDKINYIHLSYKNKGRIQIENTNIVNTINFIQSTPFVINLKVLYYILKSINNNINLGDDIFAANIHNETNKLLEYKNNGDMVKVVEILRHNSIYHNTYSTLSAALLFRNFEFYQTMFTDWRGRLYTSNSILSFQGNELTRSLLLFNKGYILNELGVKALKIYLANSFGLNKKSINYRLNWVNDNLQRILDIDSNMWLDAKEKLLFLSAALELKGYYDQPNNFISRIPIYLDATCSGLQHLASMTTDLNLANYVNLLKSSPDKEPNDVYSLMVDLVNDKLTQTNNTNIIKLNITREFIKRGIMTIPYGVTIRGIKEQLISDFFIKTNETHKYTLTHTSQAIQKVSNLYKLRNNKFLKKDPYVTVENFRLSGSEIMNLAKLIHSTLYDTYPSLTKLITYLKNMNKLLMKLNLNIGIVWKTPSGLILEQKYMEMKSDTITISILGKRKSFNLSKTTNKISLRRQNNSIVPNLIHSMDAANISLLVNSLIEDNKKLNLVTIHDCFATDANHVEFINLKVRAAFLQLYQNQTFINDFHNFIINHLINLGINIIDNNKIELSNKKIIDIPIKPDFSNSLDLKYNLFNSPYFIN